MNTGTIDNYGDGNAGSTPTHKMGRLDTLLTVANPKVGEAIFYAYIGGITTIAGGNLTAGLIVTIPSYMLNTAFKYSIARKDEVGAKRDVLNFDGPISNHSVGTLLTKDVPVALGAVYEKIQNLKK